MYDLLIIGAGPAGVSAAIYAVSRGLRVLVLEKEQVGGVIGKVSVVSHYTAIIEGESGATFAQRMERQALDAGVEIVYEPVTGVKLSGRVKKVITPRREYEARAVILANGTTPRKLEIPGEAELAGKGCGMNPARDGGKYAGKHAYVIGGADGAVKEALYLSGIADRVTIIHFEDRLGAIPEFVKKVAASSNMEVLLHSRLAAVRGGEQVEELDILDEVSGELSIRKDPGCGIFIYAGALPNTALYQELDLREGYIPVNEKLETGIPGVYAAGDLCVKQVRQAATAVADGAVAAINAAAWVNTGKQK